MRQAASWHSSVGITLGVLSLALGALVIVYGFRVQRGKPSVTAPYESDSNPQTCLRSGLRTDWSSGFSGVLSLIPLERYRMRLVCHVGIDLILYMLSSIHL